jgi:hypothetical protein
MSRVRLNCLALAALALAAGAAAAAGPGQGDPTPRKEIDPWDKAKVTHIEAKQWMLAAPETTRSDSVTGAIPGKRSCTTNIGVTAQRAPKQQPPRFGPQAQQNQLVVVTGDVINVCR